MKPRSKNLPAFVLVLLFAFGLLCSTVAAPGQSFASVQDCSHDGRPMAMVGCEHPGYLCGPGGSSNLLSHGAVSLARNDSLKNILGVAVGSGSIDLSTIRPPSLSRDSGESFPMGPPKVSIRLFNSILNL